LLLFLEKEGFYYSIGDILGGTPPKPPWVGFAESWVANLFREAEQTLFASFSGKRRASGS
jgi:hypothetical protein